MAFLSELISKVNVVDKPSPDAKFKAFLKTRSQNIQCPDIHLPKRKKKKSKLQKLKSLMSSNQDENKCDIERIHIVHISDTHMKHKKFTDKQLIPYKKGSINILIHSGDFTKRVKLEKKGQIPSQIINFNEWLISLPHEHKIVIAGNHEIALNEFSKNEIKNKVFNDERITYLQDESIHLYGIHFYGSPWTSSQNMGFSATKSELKRRWNAIPNDVDILITHMPPFGIMDTAYSNKYNFTQTCKVCNYFHPNHRHWGDNELLKQVQDRIKPKVHLFGHVHQSVGFEICENVLFINSAMDLLYIPHEFDVVFDA